MPELRYATTRTAAAKTDPSVVATFMLGLMLRNVSSDGFVFVDPSDLQGHGGQPRFSLPGCIIASPSFPENLAVVDQNYVWNWVRDAAITAIEMAAAGLPVDPDTGSGPLQDYVTFADICQRNAGGDLSYAVFTIDGQPRTAWSHQHDGPALQVLALLRAWEQLGEGARQVAQRVLENDLAFVLEHYQEPRFNLWEEVEGQSFFTRAVQLRCLQEVRDNSLGLPVPAGVDEPIAWLTARLAEHWDDAQGCYVSILEPDRPLDRYDPNIDIVLAALYGAVDVTDPRLLATAARLRQQWEDPASPVFYPVNGADAQQGLGPLLGRYPGDVYDGNFSDDGSGPQPTDHPWAVSSAALAELYYRVAAAVSGGTLPTDPLTQPFFDQVGVTADASGQTAATALRDAGDRILRAVIHHSDHLELSEQFDGRTGYEKSVRNLTWSYASFLSAARARHQV
jgi:glucoamylase